MGVKNAKKIVFAASLVCAMSLTSCIPSSNNSSGRTDTTGQTVRVWMSVDDGVRSGLEKALQAKAQADGIIVKVEAVDSLDKVIITKIQAGDQPEIALLPQPGVVRTAKELGAAKPLNDVIDVDALHKSMVPGTLDVGTLDGQLYGLLVSMNVKSLVFYNKLKFDAAGYTVPRTMGELFALTDRIKADGRNPWCMGYESGSATGWPATDWLEDLVMRRGSADDYNKWVAGEIKFDSDLVRTAAADFEKIAFTNGNVLGGRKAIPSTNFKTAGNPMFEEQPGCWMMKQGSFIVDQFPDKIKANLDHNVGVFGFPPVEAGSGGPVLSGGDLAVLMSESENAKKVMTYLADPAIGVVAAGQSAFISPHTTFDTTKYQNDFSRSVADVGYQSSHLLFDGSDQMPGEVGAGTFWTEMIAWIAGQQDLDTTLKNIDNSWPKS